MSQRANKRILGQSSWQKYWLVSVCLQCRMIIKQDFPQREKQLLTHFWMNNIHFKHGNLCIYWSPWQCYDFYQIVFGLKISHLHRDIKAWVMKEAMRARSLSHCATRGPRLHHLSFLPLAMMCFCATQCRGLTARGHRGQTQRGNQSSLSLCDSISRLCTHEWMPRHLSSEPRNEPRTRKALVRTRRVGGSRGAREHTWREINGGIMR